MERGGNAGDGGGTIILTDQNFQPSSVLTKEQ